MRRLYGGRRGDLARNAAFFLGALGSTLGIFGAALGTAALVASLAPAAAASTPDWVGTGCMVVLLILVVGLWPALDWLVGRDYRLGARALTALALVVGSVGCAVLVRTTWAFAGWLALIAVPLLLSSAWLVLRGRGTEPLTWHSLRTDKVTRVEDRLQNSLALVVGVVALGWFLSAWSGNLVLGLGIGGGLLLAGGLWQWGGRR